MAAPAATTAATTAAAAAPAAAIKPTLLATTIPALGPCQIELDASLLDIFQKTLPTLPEEVRTTITAYASKLNLDSVIDHFKGMVDPKEVEKDKAHVGCKECAGAKKRSAPKGMQLVPETQAREAVCLIDLHYTIKETDDASNVLDLLPGIDILEREPLDPSVQVLCYDIVFSHEPWYRRHRAAKQFEDRSMADILDHLITYKQYSVPPHAARGDIVIFSHGNEAVHYAVIDSVDVRGSLTLISKFGEYHVFRHKLDRLLRLYGSHFVVLRRATPFPALYTSPKTIRAGAK